MSNGTRLDGGWEEAPKRLAERVERLRKSLEQAVLRAALVVEAEVKKGILDQAPGGHPLPALHPWTIALRLHGLSASKKAAASSGDGGHKRLLNHGDLLGAITHIIGKDKLSAQVGILRTAKNRDGKSLVDIARVLSKGAVIKVTPAMRAWLHYHDLHLKPSTTSIILPATPFLEPAWIAVRPKVVAMLRDAVTSGAGGG